MPNKSLEGFISSILLLIVFLIILLQVFTRIFHLFSVVWTEELSRWVWVWVVCICWGELERSDHHLKMDFIRSKMSDRMRLLTKIFANLIYLIVVINLFIIGIQQVFKTLHSSAVTLPVNGYILYLSLPIGLLFVLYRVIFTFIHDIKKVIRS